MVNENSPVGVLERNWKSKPEDGERTELLVLVRNVQVGRYLSYPQLIRLLS